ncbi:MAG: spore coat U domain-containing protein [Gammaproteobacteria bacterium]
MRYLSLLMGLILAGISYAESPAPLPIIACTFPSINGIAFGTYTVEGQNLTSVGSITYHCTGPVTAVAIKITAGSAGEFNRAMLNNITGERLYYNLYLDPARQIVWGEGSSGTGIYEEKPTPDISRSIPVYGYIPSGQDVGPGVYRDQLIVSLDFQ